jgi:hypothetical protein
MQRAGAPAGRARAGIVPAHGRGGSAADIVGLMAQAALPDVAATAPEAPGRSWRPTSFLAPMARTEPFVGAGLAALPGAMDDPRLLAIGDGVMTDVQGAVAEGIDVIFVTGGLAAASFGSDPENPDSALLDDWLADLELSATYGIGRMR